MLRFAAWQRDSSNSHQILRAAVDEVYVKAMYADDNTLYWSEGRALPPTTVDPGMGPPWLPPGLLYSVPKQGGEVELLHQDDSHIYDPVGTLDERLVLQRDDSVLFTIAKDGTGLKQLGWGEQTFNLSVIDDQVYWLQSTPSGEIGEYFELWRSDFDRVSPVLVARIEGSNFLSRDGRILWIQERMHTDPLVLDQNFVMFDEATGCTSTLPGLGETISSDSVMGDRHVYWYSFNGLEGISPGDPPIEMPLVRVDLNTGALEQIVTPGFTAVLGDNIVGQTIDTLYIITGNGQLVAIEKP